MDRPKPGAFLHPSPYSILSPMFGFGRKNAIEERAKSIADLTLFLAGCLETLSFEEFVAAIRRQGFTDSYLETDGLRGEKSYGFFRGDPEQADFSFHVIYEDDGSRRIGAEGHRDCYGLALNIIAGQREIGADMKDALPSQEYGRDAKSLQSALLKFPGFGSLDQLYAKYKFDR
jgi:hypothetical protein